MPLRILGTPETRRSGISDFYCSSFVVLWAKVSFSLFTNLKVKSYKISVKIINNQFVISCETCVKHIRNLCIFLEYKIEFPVSKFNQSINRPINYTLLSLF